MQHIVNIAIDVEDEKIAKSIEKNVENQVINLITDKIMDRICRRSYYGRTNDYTPLEDMILSKIDEILAEHKDRIVEVTSKNLAEKLARSKAGKAILSQYESEANG